jgi:acyl-ACP thioesterase
MIKPLEIQYVIRGYDCSYGGPLTPLALANFFQEAAGEHASVLGIGMEGMRARGLTWMLSRIDIRIDSMPQAGQTVIARTWPAGTRKLFALRCLELVDGGGTKYAGAMYEYIVVDLKTRRVMRPERTLPLDLSTDYPWPFDDLAPGIDDASFEALGRYVAGEGDVIAGGSAPSGGFSQSFAIEARGRHIDQNGHVNNAHFINWLCDAAPLREGQRFSRIKVDFVHEILRGEEVGVWAKEYQETNRPGTRLAALSHEKRIVARGAVAVSGLSSGREFPCT